MMSFLIDNKQEAEMNEWIKLHNQNKKCPAYKKRKKREKGKGNPYGVGTISN